MRILKYAIKNIKRNTFLSISSFLVLSLLIFFIHILLLVNFTTDKLIENINKRLSMSVILQKWYSNDNSEVVELISWLRWIGNNLDVSYISSQEAFAVLKKTDPELTKVVEEDSENPLPASIKIENMNVNQYNDINEQISKYKWIIVYDEQKFKKKIVAYRDQYNKIQTVISVFVSIKYWIIWIISFFIFSVFIIIYNTIWNFIFFHRDEIKVTKLVWWDNIFIYWPFSVQGFLYTFFSTIFSLIIFLYIIKTVNIYLIENFPDFINEFLSKNSLYFLYELLILSLIGLISWFLSSIKFIWKSK